jgi:hypothetical protein
MAQQKKASKVGRNKAKCERYRARHGRTVGSKKPKKPGSNSTSRTYGAGTVHTVSATPNVELPFDDNQGTVEIGVALVSRNGESRRVHPNGGTRLLEVPAEWVR